MSVMFLAAVCGCQSSTNRAPEGALIGGLIGAGTGVVLGNQMHNRDKGRTQGALIGGALGALGGAAVGSQIQKEPPAQPANPSQMSILQVIEMSKQGVNEDVIVDRIRMSNSRFTLSPDDVSYLQGQGVSQKVISAMQGYY